MSLILGLFEAQMPVLATAIVNGQRGPAQRSLGALLIVLCGMLTPFTISYAGFYHRWPWRLENQVAASVDVVNGGIDTELVGHSMQRTLHRRFGTDDRRAHALELALKVSRKHTFVLDQ